MTRASDLLLPALRWLNVCVPECRLKNRIRSLLLTVRRGLPRELMVGRGETAVQVGMWRRRNLERLSACVGPNGRVILIEVDPRVVQDLTAFIAERHIENVTIVNKGASDQKARKELRMGVSPSFSRLDGTNVHMLSEVAREAFSGTETVDVDTVDAILAENGVDRVDYIEITVNGLELQVLKGLAGALRATERLFLSGYARSSETNEPTNRLTRDFLRTRGFQTKVSRRTRPRMAHFDREAARDWGLMEGHVFAWRE